MDTEKWRLAEFDRLRQELDNRTQINSAVVGIELTALAAGIAVYNDFPDVLIALAYVSSFLWLLWIDHAGQCYKIGAYIGVKVAPAILKADKPVLGWEHFFREVDKGGSQALAALDIPEYIRQKSKPWWKRPRESARQPVGKTPNVGHYVAAVFGGTPGVLILIGALKLRDGGGVALVVGRMVALFGAVFLWAFAIWSFRRFGRLVAAIDVAIDKAAKEDSRS